MADQSSGSNESKIRFLKFTNDKEDAEKEAKLKEAAAKIEQAIAKDRAVSELIDYQPPEDGPEAAIDPAKDSRSLYERLQEQRDKKKEALDEAHKLSNLITKLDEDDVSYLNEVARAKQEEQLRKRLEVHDALEAKKRKIEESLEEDEKKLKKSLLGGAGLSAASSRIASVDSKSIKSKLSSMIKVKSKAKLHSQTSRETSNKTGPDT